MIDEKGEDSAAVGIFQPFPSSLRMCAFLQNRNKAFMRHGTKSLETTCNGAK